MRAGRLDRTIVIERPSTGIDVYGTPTIGWTPVATMRAQILGIATEEFTRGQGNSTETVVTFRMRWLDDVTPANLITYEGQAFDIKETKEIGRRRGLDIRCVKVGP